MGTPDIVAGPDRIDVSVVVPSHDRPARLCRLLDALEGQTLARERFEVVVVHDSRAPETEALLRSHALAEAGVLHHVALAPGTGAPGRQRNVGWRAARAPLIAFTDDDCRPAPPWLERLVDVAGRHPAAVVQGTTRPDPDEAHLLARPYARSMSVDPPGPYAQTCNIAYPRSVLGDVHGFDERLPGAAGEDTDLALRAIEAGTGYVGAPEALVYHAVDPSSLLGRLRSLPRWQHVVYVVKRHPQVRRRHFHGIFWKRSHAWLPLAVAGALLAPRRPALALLALPWVRVTRADVGPRSGGRGRWVAWLPGRAAIDLVEFAYLVRGSMRYRTILL